MKYTCNCGKRHHLGGLNFKKIPNQALQIKFSEVMFLNQAKCNKSRFFTNAPLDRCAQIWLLRIEAFCTDQCFYTNSWNYPLASALILCLKTGKKIIWPESRTFITQLKYIDDRHATFDEFKKVYICSTVHLHTLWWGSGYSYCTVIHNDTRSSEKPWPHAAWFRPNSSN